MANTGRRALLAAPLALPMLVITATATPIAGDPQWTAVYAAFRTADAEQNQLHSIYAALEDEWVATKSLREPEPQPLATPDFDTSLSMKDALAAAVGPEWIAAWEARDAERKAWRERDDAAFAMFVGDAETRWETADAACDRALRALIDYPVTSLAALAEKAQVITERFGDMIDGDDAKVLVVDIRRLAGGEVAA